MARRSPAPWLLATLAAACLPLTALPASGLPITQPALTRKMNEEVPKTTQVIGWGAARSAATPHAALRDLAVTGPGDAAGQAPGAL